MINNNKFVFKDFIQLSKKQLLVVLQWRNHPSVSQGMLNESVAEDEHFAFVEKLKNTKEKKYWLVFKKDEPIGVFNLTDITHLSADIGLYLSPNKIGQGLGTPFLQAALDFVQDSFTLKLLKLEVFEKNIPAFHLYEKIGFAKKGKRQHPKGTLIQMELPLN